MAAKMIEIRNLREDAQLKDQIVEYLIAHGHGPRGDWCDTRDIQAYYQYQNPIFPYVLCDALESEGRVVFKFKPTMEQAFGMVANPDALIGRIQVRATQLAWDQRHAEIRTMLDEENLKSVRPGRVRANITLAVAIVGLGLGIVNAINGCNREPGTRSEAKTSKQGLVLPTIPHISRERPPLVRLCIHAD